LYFIIIRARVGSRIPDVIFYTVRVRWSCVNTRHVTENNAEVGRERRSVMHSLLQFISGDLLLATGRPSFCRRRGSCFFLFVFVVIVTGWKR
jgi:hypothetical protein